jgi:hypothetical protein
MARELKANWRNRNLPHPMSPQWGGSFCLGRLAQGRRPRQPPTTWGFEEAKVQSQDQSFPLTGYHQSQTVQLISQ